jgi:hypothetical protein
MKGKKRSAIITIHHALAMFSTTNTHKGVLIIFVIRTIQTKQTPVGLSTQGDHVLGKQVFNMIKREKDSHRRLRNLKAKTHQLKSLNERPTIRAKLRGSDIKDPKHRFLEFGKREIQMKVLYEPSVHIERNMLGARHTKHILALLHRFQNDVILVKSP